MTREFKFNKGNLDNLTRFYHKSPGIFRKASTGMINNLAFRLRKHVLEEIEGSMTIRSSKFVEGSVRVKMARPSDQKAVVGSIRRERFTGWAEQEKGLKDPRDRIHTVTARTDNWKRRVAPRFRLKPGRKKAVRPSDIVSPLIKSKKRKTLVFLQMLDRIKWRQPFYIPVRYKRLQRGIYIFRKNKIRRVQDFDTGHQPIEKNPWMSRSVKRIIKKSVADAWRDSIIHNLKKAGYGHRRL
jgi:hypothetical protein